MQFEAKEVELKDGTRCVLRSPNEQDAESMIEYLKTTSDETHFMIRYSEEIAISIEEEKKILNENIKSNKDIMVAAFVNNELAGNAGISCVRDNIKLKHRATFGISIKEKYWNNGIGNVILKEIIKQAKSMRYEQLELGVFDDNKRAQALYKKHNISMFSSFSTFLTLPIMLAVWQAVQRVEILYSSTLFGLKLGITPMSAITKGEWAYIVIVALVGLTQYFAIEINSIMLKRNPRYKVSRQQQSMKTMNIVMTVMIVWFAVSMPTAMSLYWITTSLITIARTIYIQLYHIEKKKDK